MFTRFCTVMTAAWLCLGSAFAEPIIGPQIERKAAARLDGELLIGELNCVACHKASDITLERLHTRSAPLLQDVGSRVTVQELRQWISDPQSAKPGATMPNLLHQLPGGD